MSFFHNHPNSEVCLELSVTELMFTALNYKYLFCLLFSSFNIKHAIFIKREWRKYKSSLIFLISDGNINRIMVKHCQLAHQLLITLSRVFLLHYRLKIED